MLYPDYYYESIFIIPYQELLDKSIRGLIFDVDNTLVPFDTTRPPAKIKTLLHRLQRMGFTVCLLSNNTKKRVGVFNEDLQVTAIHSAMKPLSRGINRAIKQMGTRREETVIIGDQLFSDVWGGKNAKITTIMVKPISKKDFRSVKIKRIFERMVMKHYVQK